MPLFTTQELNNITNVTMPEWDESSNIGRRPVWFVNKGKLRNVVKAEVIAPVAPFSVDVFNQRLRDSWKIINYFYYGLGVIPKMRLLRDNEINMVAAKLTNAKQKEFCRNYITAGTFGQCTVFYLMELVALLWTFYLVLLFVYDDQFFGDRHIATYVVAFGSLFWSLYLFIKLLKITKIRI